MKDVNPAHLRPKNSTQQQIPDKLAYMPLQGISLTGEGSISPVNASPNVEYAPLDMRTRSWEVKRNNVKIERIIGKGAFGQVAKGKATDLPLTSRSTHVAIKMVKGKFLISNSFSVTTEQDQEPFKSDVQNTIDYKSDIDFVVTFVFLFLPVSIYYFNSNSQCS